MTVNKINLQGDPSADLTINCDSETFRVHKYFLCSKSPVFSAMLTSGLREDREGEINIVGMRANTLLSMINYIYTGELAEGWVDLDIEDMAEAADMYDLPGWMKLFCSKLRIEEEVTAEKVAEMIIVGSRYKDRAPWELMEVARDKIREKREITEDPVFREMLREDPEVLLEFLAVMSVLEECVKCDSVLNECVNCGYDSDNSC